MSGDPENFLPLLAKRGWPESKSMYVSLAVWAQALGLLLVLAPPSWFGPSWSYFPQLPHNGTGMGLCLLFLGGGQLVAIANDRIRACAILIFLGGFVCWTAGIILAAEGILGHQGLMESPFMLTVGAYKFTHSGALSAEYRRDKKRRK